MKSIYTKIKRKMTEIKSKFMDTDARIYYLQHHDLLTELPNREKLIDTFNESQAANDKKEKGIVVINLDRLHSINELYGRDIGDKVIVRLSKRLKRVFKEEDTVFREEHFYLCLEDISKQGLEQIGKDVRNIVNTPLMIDGQKFHMTASIGMSHYPTTGDNIVTLLQQAEIAMAKVKAEGKNNYGVILPEDISAIERKLKIEFDLKDVLGRDELYLAYQPEIELKTGEIIAAEALLRWEHPELGNISPVEFIPVAEETGIINEIGKWVIHEAAQQAKEWHNQGLKICLAVNISYVQFKDSMLAQNIIDILTSLDFDPSYFIIEITESLMKDLEHVELVTKDLNKHKIRIAIDDFGTGYSSLSVLGNMYIDMIKIDRAFVKGLPADEKSVQIVKTMIQIGNNLDCTVVAEGVEELEQLDFLVENGCKYAQGFYFSKPVSPDRILEYAKK